MSITIVIPVYNEEKRVIPTLQGIIDYMSQRGIAWDIVIVDDGSTDNTTGVIKDRYPKVRILKLGKNFGKGKAIRQGMLEGKGDYLLFMDADSSTPIEEFEKFLPVIKQHKDIIIGSRKVLGAEIIEHQSFFREFFGKGFTWLSNIITQVHVSDFTCGFKCFSRKAAMGIFSKALIDDWSFDAEILFLARKSGYKIVEIPVRWKNNRASRVRMLRDTINSLKGLLRIRIYSIKGIYEK